MTLATHHHPQSEYVALQLLFQASAKQGLIPQSEALPDLPTLEDIHRLRQLLPLVWSEADERKKEELYRASLEILTTGPKPLQMLVQLPSSLPHAYRLMRKQGVHKAFVEAKALEAALKGFLQDIISHWENDNPAFQERLASAIKSVSTPGSVRIRSRGELKAVLDDLF